MTPGQRNRLTAREALKMASGRDQKVAIAVDDDERAGNMLILVTKAARKLRIDIGAPNYRDGVITIPVGEGEVRIVSADHLVPKNALN